MRTQIHVKLIYTFLSVFRQAFVFLTVSFLVCGSDRAQSCPSENVGGALWRSFDLGAVGTNGFTIENRENLLLSGSGEDIAGTNDEFRFALQTISGDCEVETEVASIEETSAWAKAGLMFRETSDANSKYVAILVTPGKGINFQWRNTGGGNYTYFNDNGKFAPCWLRLTRTANLFKGYTSRDGRNWEPCGNPQNIPMDRHLSAGLAVTSHDNVALCEASFINASLTALPSPWQKRDIGHLIGNVTMENDGITMTSIHLKGTDSSGAYCYTYQLCGNKCAITSRVPLFTSSSISSEAGLMVRTTLNAGAGYAAILASDKADRLFFRVQTAPDTGTTWTNTRSPQAPCWMRLARDGDRFSAYCSTNGVTWSNIGTAKVGMPSTAYIGPVISAQDAFASSSAVFNNVSVAP